MQLKGQSSTRRNNTQTNTDSRVKTIDGSGRRPSYISDIIDEQNMSHQMELRRLRDRLKDDTKQYLDKEKLMVVQQQLEKVRESHYLQRSIEEYQSMTGSHQERLKHHELIAARLSKFREKEKNEEVLRQSSYKDKWQKLGRRLEDFLKTKEVSRKKSIRTVSAHSMREYRSSKKEDATLTNGNGRPKKNTIRSKKMMVRRVTAAEISGRVAHLKNLHDQKNLREYMERLHEAENRMIRIEIDREMSRRQCRSKPIRILTATRNERQENRRQQFEKQYQQKIQNHSQISEKHKRSQQEHIYNKSMLEQQHNNKVIQRKWRLQQLDMNRRIEDAMSQTNRSDELEMRKKRLEKVIIMKRKFQLKKQQQIDKYALDLSRLTRKLHDLHLVPSEETLNEKQTKSSLNLVKSLLNSNKDYTQLFTKPKKQLGIAAYNQFLHKSSTKITKIR